MTNARDDLGFRKQLAEGGQACAPSAAGIEDNLGTTISVVIVEQATQHTLALGVVDKHAELVSTAHFTEQATEHASQRAGHARAKTRVLCQQCR